MRLRALILCALLLSVAASNINLAPVESWLEDNFDENLANLIELLSIPSVSSDNARAHEVRRAAEWLVDDLGLSGLENVDILEAGGHPAVYADWLHAEDPDAPTVLIYGHFDVQPEDPVDLWTTPPFSPRVRDGKLYARGASDDKGHLYVPLMALKAYLSVAGALPVNVKVLLEGEEEVGSPTLEKLLVKHVDLLKAYYSFSADGGQVNTEIPGLCIGLRGSVAVEIDLAVADIDMHSGSFGGGVQNPNIALARLLATLHDPVTNEVAIKGFYDDVHLLTDEERVDIAGYPEKAEHKLAELGVNETVGEDRYSFYERTWARPAIDVVGMWGGFTGEGLKTVLPRESHAKISARLVPYQEVGKSLEQLKAHLITAAEQIPGISLQIKTCPFSADAYKMPKSTPGNSAATKVLTELYGRKPAFFQMGGSIPVMPYLQKYLNLETTMFAFGHPDENVHAPNEFARLDSFRRGQKAYVRLLAELATNHKDNINSDNCEKSEL